MEKTGKVNFMKLHEIVSSSAVGSNLIPKRLGEEEPLRFNPFLDFMKQFTKKEVEKMYSEDVEYIKFKYGNYHNDKAPKVKVLDFEYPGRPGQKTYGQRKDVLGWNINYVEGGRGARKEAIGAIDDILDFTDLLGGDKLEKYNRIVTMFPQIAEHLRRYVKQHMTSIKHKPGMMWKRAQIEDLTRG